jgi:hypothetical protein
MDTRHLDVLFAFTMQDPELKRLFQDRATAFAPQIMHDILNGEIEQSTPSSNGNGKMNFSEIRQYMMEILKDHPEVVVGDFRKHPRLKGLSASVFNQNLAVLKKEGKVKKTKRTIGPSTVWVRA